MTKQKVLKTLLIPLSEKEAKIVRSMPRNKKVEDVLVDTAKTGKFDTIKLFMKAHTYGVSYVDYRISLYHVIWNGVLYYNVNNQLIFLDDKTKINSSEKVLRGINNECSKK